MSFCVQYCEGETRLIDDGRGGLRLELAAPALGVQTAEHWPLLDGGKWNWRKEGDWHVGECGDSLWACAVGDAADGTLEAVTGSLYTQLFAICRGWRLQRVWHYLPRINEPGVDGLERYRVFCRGRSLAFEKAYGKAFHAHLPAASAVGCAGGSLALYACARADAQVRYLENPLQVPAYLYPKAYGPRAPGFARASLTLRASADAPDGLRGGDASQNLCSAQSAQPSPFSQASPSAQVSQSAQALPIAQLAADLCEIHISGTASIRQERSLTDGGISGQLEVTVGNLNQIAAQCGLLHFLPTDATSATDGENGGVATAAGIAEDVSTVVAVNAADAGIAAGGVVPVLAGEVLRRRFKVYLRHARDYPEISSKFGAYLRPADEVLYVCSDICRAELDLEIEASVIARR